MLNYAQNEYSLVRKLHACVLQFIPGLFSTTTQMKRPGYEARVATCGPTCMS